MDAKPDRLPSLDIARGLALLCMAVFHAAYDLRSYWRWDIDVYHDGWWLLARMTATVFLLVSGMAVALSEERMRALPAATRWHKRLARFGILLFCALCVSVATFVLDPRTAVVFGILHLLAVSRLLLPLCASWRGGNIALGALCIALGWNGPWNVSTSLMVPLGFVPEGFASVDYFPLLPWFGVPLIGMGIMSLSAFRRIVGYPLRVYRWLTPLAWLGKRSLVVYLLHQPLLLAALSVLFGPPHVL